MSRTGKPTQHTALLVYLSRALDEEQFLTMKNTVKSTNYGGFLAGELQKMDSVQKILEKMEHKGVFRVKTHPQKTVDYRNLKKIIKECQNDDAVNEIVSTESKLAADGYYVESEDQADAGCSVMETDPPYNPHNRNKSRSDKSDAFPSDIGVSVSGGGDEFRYDAKGKGYLLFINMFENSGQPRRKGSEKDRDSIEALFEDEDSGCNLNFKCNFEKDLNKRQLLALLQKTKAKLKTGKYSSFVLIICSHGEQFKVKGNDIEATIEGIATIDKQFITEEELTKPFLGDELKELNNKPKVFIIQACRAPRPDKSDDMESSSPEEEIPDDSTQASVRMPENADMLISYATTKGTKAWRNEDGSWYISELCKAIKKYSKKKHFWIFWCESIMP